MGREERGRDCLGKGGEGPEVEKLPRRKDVLGGGGTQLGGGEEQQREREILGLREKQTK